MKRLLVGALAVASLSVGVTAGPAHAGTTAPSSHAALVKATNTFGYWVTYYARYQNLAPNRLLKPAYVNAQAANLVAPSYLNRHIYHNIGGVLGDMHLVNTPSDYRFSINRTESIHTTETIHWLFGPNPHTPIDRLTWTSTSAGWKLTNAVFLRIS